MSGDYRRAYGTIINRIAGGFWWSSTTGSDVDIYGRRLGAYDNAVSAQYDARRGYGFAIRCVARWGMALASPTIIVLMNGLCSLCRLVTIVVLLAILAYAHHMASGGLA